MNHMNNQLNNHFTTVYKATFSKGKVISREPINFVITDQYPLTSEKLFHPETNDRDAVEWFLASCSELECIQNEFDRFIF